MDEVWLEGCCNFIKSASYLDHIEAFATCHCGSFRPDYEFKHEQHSVWRSFQHIIENMLEEVLIELGGSVQALEKALDETAMSEPTGPRDAASKELLRLLLTYDDFGSFADAMQSKFATQQVHGAQSDPCRASEDAELLDDDEIPESMQQLLVEVQDTEWATQVALATSIVEAYESSQLPRSEQELLPWAAAVHKINYLFANYGPGTGPMSTTLVHDLEALHKTMRRERLRIDLVATQHMANENEKLRLQAEVVKQERYRLEQEFLREQMKDESLDGATEEETQLHQLLERSDEVQKQMSLQRQAVLSVVQQGCPQEKLEDVYIYLKSKVNNQQELEMEDVHGYVSERIPQALAVVPDLLDLMLLEDEDSGLRKTIRELCTTPRSRAAAEAEEAAQAKESGAFGFALQLQADVAHGQGSNSVDRLEQHVGEQESATKRYSGQAFTTVQGHIFSDNVASDAENTMYKQQIRTLQDESQTALLQLGQQMEQDRARRLEALRRRQQARRKHQGRQLDKEETDNTQEQLLELEARENNDLHMQFIHEERDSREVLQQQQAQIIHMAKQMQSDHQQALQSLRSEQKDRREQAKQRVRARMQQRREKKLKMLHSEDVSNETLASEIKIFESKQACDENEIMHVFTQAEAKAETALQQKQQAALSAVQNIRKQFEEESVLVKRSLVHHKSQQQIRLKARLEARSRRRKAQLQATTSMEQKERAQQGWQLQDAAEESNSTNVEFVDDALAMKHLSSHTTDVAQMFQRLHAEDMEGVLHTERHMSAERLRRQQKFEAQLSSRNQNMVRGGVSSAETCVVLAQVSKTQELRLKKREEKATHYGHKIVENMSARRAATERGMSKLQHQLVTALTVAQEHLQHRHTLEEEQRLTRHTARCQLREAELTRACASKAQQEVALAELAEQEAGGQEVLAHRQATNEMQVFSQLNFRAKQGMKDLNRLHIAYSDCISELQNEAEKETKLNLQLLHEEQRARRTIREVELVASGMSNDMIPAKIAEELSEREQKEEDEIIDDMADKWIQMLATLLGNQEEATESLLQLRNQAAAEVQELQKSISKEQQVQLEDMHTRIQQSRTEKETLMRGQGRTEEEIKEFLVRCSVDAVAAENELMQKLTAENHKAVEQLEAHHRDKVHRLESMQTQHLKEVVSLAVQHRRDRRRQLHIWQRQLPVRQNTAADQAGHEGVTQDISEALTSKFVDSQVEFSRKLGIDQRQALHVLLDRQKKDRIQATLLQEQYSHGMHAIQQQLGQQRIAKRSRLHQRLRARRQANEDDLKRRGASPEQVAAEVKKLIQLEAEEESKLNQEIQQQDREAYNSCAPPLVALQQITKLLDATSNTSGMSFDRADEELQTNTKKFADADGHKTSTSTSLSGELPPINFVGTAAGKSIGDAQLASELQRISAEHQEERQKLQLSIQMEKARQRQKLLQRRKLRQQRRNCSTQSKNAPADHPAAIVSSLHSSVSVPVLQTPMESKQDYNDTEYSVSSKEVDKKLSLDGKNHGRIPQPQVNPRSESLLYLQGRVHAWK